MMWGFPWRQAPSPKTVFVINFPMLGLFLCYGPRSSLSSRQPKIELALDRPGVSNFSPLSNDFFSCGSPARHFKRPFPNIGRF